MFCTVYHSAFRIHWLPLEPFVYDINIKTYTVLISLKKILSTHISIFHIWYTYLCKCMSFIKHICFIYSLQTLFQILQFEQSKAFKSYATNYKYVYDIYSFYILMNRMNVLWYLIIFQITTLLYLSPTWKTPLGSEFMKLYF